MNQPSISILVAARNEEKNILELLLSLSKLSYPKEQIQILIGNDDSTDKTAQIVESFIAKNNGYRDFQLVNIQHQVANLKGKANVLAQLAHLAIGEYFFFTDADIEVPEYWIEGFLSEMQNTGVGVGLSLVKHRNWFEASQAIEWLFALNLMKTFSDFKLPTTGMGNNMVVSAEAYWAVGGYEKIGFSIVEDYAIYKAIIDKGFGFKQLFRPEVLAITKPPQNYFEQRKRWVTGGISTGSLLIYPAIIQGLALPILLIIGVFSCKTTLIIMILNLLVNFFIGQNIFKTLHQTQLLKYIPAYTIYMYVFWFLQLVVYLLPTKLVWKGREY
ncbi:glycosyl transferase family 2 [Emticicia oligotrophica DSM 17448]|uniref:Glycosyl transferase family 2 n=1 Tax=Emticicia oligotrophica (strain DSM 17448 / CIP 109782 / MTCC 6937 / GPTSA100-15) TaxID=929562 RepID=A0ABN4ANC3_EMTOG|nr:glycosyltransferase [Emticicia oligotrophica]AFK03938.1 glycosyl transferase family 2 [Emticicia oligotrophica DSM 17448]